jgi:hypothetical protein
VHGAEDAGIKLSTVASGILGASGRALTAEIDRRLVPFEPMLAALDTFGRRADVTMRYFPGRIADRRGLLTVGCTCVYTC